MILTDILLILALAVFVIAWWVRKLPARRIALVVAAASAILVAVGGAMNDRWQDGIGVVVGVTFLTVLAVTLLKNRMRKTQTGEGVPFVSGVFVALLAGAAAVFISMFPVGPLPKPSGQYAVGVRTFDLTDAIRKGVLGAQADEPRRVLVRVWYPAGDVSAKKRAPYFSAREAETTARSLGELFSFPPFMTYTRHAMTNSYVDAPVAPGAAGLPVVFYSHGYTSFLSQNTVLMEHLASHGYVVFSVQHPYDSSTTAFADGAVIPMSDELKTLAKLMEPGLPYQKEALGGATLDARLEGAIAYQEFSVKAGDRIATKSTPAWVGDRMFVHDTLQMAPPASVADIVAAAKLDHVGEMGMSFGGAVAGEVCMIDPRCAAGINLDGGNFTFTAFDADVPAPFLMFHSDMGNLYRSMQKPLPEGLPRSYNEFSYERIATAGTRPDVYRVQLKNAQHLGLSDFSLFMNSPAKDSLVGAAPSEVLIGAQNDFVLGFFDKHMRGAANGFPEKELAAYAGKVFATSNADIPAWWNAKPEAERAALEARANAVKPKY